MKQGVGNLSGVCTILEMFSKDSDKGLCSDLLSEELQSIELATFSISLLKLVICILLCSSESLRLCRW